MNRFHEMADVIDIATGTVICTGLLIILPLYKERAMIVIQKNNIPRGKSFVTDEGLVLTSRTPRGQQFLWSFEGVRPRTEKGEEMIRIAQATYRLRNEPIPGAPEVCNNIYVSFFIFNTDTFI